MLISTRGRYALRIMIDLAEHQTDDGYVPLKETARRQEISEKYLESILKILVKQKLLIGLRGKGGGYRLAKEPEQYTIWSILILTETSLSPVSCLEPGHDACPRSSHCKTLPMWQGLNAVIHDYLTQITLADLLADTTPSDRKLL